MSLPFGDPIHGLFIRSYLDAPSVGENASLQYANPASLPAMLNQASGSATPSNARELEAAIVAARNGRWAGATSGPPPPLALSSSSGAAGNRHASIQPSLPHLTDLSWRAQSSAGPPSEAIPFPSSIANGGPHFKTLLSTAPPAAGFPQGIVQPQVSVVPQDGSRVGFSHLHTTSHATDHLQPADHSSAALARPALSAAVMAATSPLGDGELVQPAVGMTPLGYAPAVPPISMATSLGTTTGHHKETPSFVRSPFGSAIPSFGEQFSGILKREMDRASIAIQRQVLELAASATLRLPRSSAWLRDNHYFWIEDISVLDRSINGQAQPEDLVWLVDPRTCSPRFKRPTFPARRGDACRAFANAFAQCESDFFNAWHEYETIVRYGGKFEEDVVRRAFGAAWRVYLRMKARGFSKGERLREHYRWQARNGLFADGESESEADADGEAEETATQDT